MIVELDRGDLAAVAELLERIRPGGAVVAAEKLFEPGSAEPLAIGARIRGALAGVAVIAGPYLRLLAVAPEHRGRGLGSALLERAPGVEIAAAEPGNYLTPGIAEADAATVGWLERRGFGRCGEATDLWIDVAGNPRVSGERLGAARERIAMAGYRIERVAPGSEGLVAAIARDHGPAWAVEVGRALREPSGVFAARDRDGAIIGFAARDGNNRGLGGFGPAAVDPAHRGRGLGEALLLSCLLDVAASGHARCTVGWVGPRAFYQRAAGISGEERFVRMRRSNQR